MSDIRKLEKLIEDGEKLVDKRATSNLPEFAVWLTNVKRYLINRFGEKSLELREVRSRAFGPTATVIGSQHDDSIECVRDIQATILELKAYLEEEMTSSAEINSQGDLPIKFANKIFIVHGHDGAIKEAVARLLEKQDIEPIILNEQANQGQTIIEKFERHSDVGAAVALFTNDDIGFAKDSDCQMPRARQNVVFEAGYFMGKLGRDRVVIIAEKGIEIPSDLQGVVYTDRNNWQFDVCKELIAMGYKIDLNKLVE